MIPHSVLVRADEAVRWGPPHRVPPSPYRHSPLFLSSGFRLLFVSRDRPRRSVSLILRPGLLLTARQSLFGSQERTRSGILCREAFQAEGYATLRMSLCGSRRREVPSGRDPSSLRSGTLTDPGEKSCRPEALPVQDRAPDPAPWVDRGPSALEESVLSKVAHCRY
jgi:hypothetical protein